MKNSERFYNRVTGFIDEMAEAVAKYNTTVERLERYRGSSGYDRDIQEAQNKRNAAVKGLRETYWPAFQEIVNDMRGAVKNRPIVAPTTEQSALLSVMQMRTTLSRDELERAAQQLVGCPMALAVLDDLATRHHAMGRPFNTVTDIDLLHTIDNLEDAALRLIQEDVNAANRRKPETVTDCIEKFGGIGPIPRPGVALYGDITSADLVQNTAAISAFCAAIDQ